METAVEDLLTKVRAIAETAQVDLLRQIVDLIYDRILEEFDTEPLSEEDLEAIRRGKEDIKQGRYITLEEFERKYGL